MSTQVQRKKGNASIWVTIGAIALIILLIIWLTVADFTGDTDVAAMIAPILEVYILNAPLNAKQP